MYWKKLKSSDGQEWTGHFVPLGEPVWGILDRSTGSTWPVTNVTYLFEAAKNVVAPPPTTRRVATRGAKK